MTLNDLFELVERDPSASEWLLRVGPIAKRLREESQEDGRPAQKALPGDK